jgi:hypothetical protein
MIVASLKLVSGRMYLAALVTLMTLFHPSDNANAQGIASTLPNMRGFLENKSPSCVAFKNKCMTLGFTDPKSAPAKFAGLSRDITGWIKSLPAKDAAILKCSSVATGQVLSIAANGPPNFTKDPIGYYGTASKTVCALNSCLNSIAGYKNPQSAAMAAACSFGSTAATVIECIGFPGLGGGYAADCENAIRNGAPINLEPCPSGIKPSVDACRTDPRDVETQCIAASNTLKRQGIIRETQVASCSNRCKELTSAASRSCPGPSSVTVRVDARKDTWTSVSVPAGFNLANYSRSVSGGWCPWSLGSTTANQKCPQSCESVNCSPSSGSLNCKINDSIYKDNSGSCTVTFRRK